MSRQLQCQHSCTIPISVVMQSTQIFDKLAQLAIPRELSRTNLYASVGSPEPACTVPELSTTLGNKLSIAALLRYHCYGICDFQGKPRAQTNGEKSADHRVFKIDDVVNAITAPQEDLSRPPSC